MGGAPVRTVTKLLIGVQSSGKGGNANVNMKQGGAKIADGRQTGLRNFFLQIPIGTPRDSIPKSNLGSDRR